MRYLRIFEEYTENLDESNDHKFYCLPTDERLEDAGKKIGINDKSMLKYRDIADRYKLKYIYIGLLLRNNGSFMYGWDDDPEPFIFNHYTFNGYIDIPDDEIQDIEIDKEAKKYNL